jgi:type IV pilus assembly protein PilA
MGIKNFKGFTLIELLVVVAIIGILAAVGVVAYNGYTGAAKASATQSNHKLVSNYIQNELKKCDLGESNIMFSKGASLRCNGLNSASVINYIVATPQYSPFADLKNIYNPNSNQQAQSKGVRQHNSWVQNQNWLDSDVGTIWLAPKSNSEIHIRTCFKTSCSTSSNRIETMVYIE